MDIYFCIIDGKVQSIAFTQSVADGRQAIAEGTLSNRMRTMDVTYQYLKSKKTGRNLLHKKPNFDLTGIWNAENGKVGSLELWMSETGRLVGYMDSEKCKVLGQVSAHSVKFSLFWQVKKYRIGSFEGFVNNVGSKLLLTYALPKPDGTEVGGVVVLRKNRVSAVEVSIVDDSSASVELISRNVVCCSPCIIM